MRAEEAGSAQSEAQHSDLPAGKRPAVRSPDTCLVHCPTELSCQGPEWPSPGVLGNQQSSRQR